MVSQRAVSLSICGFVARLDSGSYLKDKKVTTPLFYQAAKPKAASACEKENNPVRTPEALPEAKKTEYRLLKEEIARYQLNPPLQTRWRKASVLLVLGERVKCDCLQQGEAEDAEGSQSECSELRLTC